MPGSDLARQRVGQGTIGRFAPGSELALEQKGSVVGTLLTWIQCIRKHCCFDGVVDLFTEKRCFIVLLLQLSRISTVSRVNSNSTQQRPRDGRCLTPQSPNRYDLVEVGLLLGLALGLVLVIGLAYDLTT